jgi:hypothetical protein
MVKGDEYYGDSERLYCDDGSTGEVVLFDIGKMM